MLATIGVYGIVALIVRMDDFGYTLIKKGTEKSQKFIVKIGEMLVAALPKVIRALSVIGTLAMLLVAGGIYLHNVESLHHIFHAIPSLVSEFLIGLWLGVVALIVMMILAEIRALFKK
jgi:hypothetical protein